MAQIDATGPSTAGSQFSQNEQRKLDFLFAQTGPNTLIEHVCDDQKQWHIENMLKKAYIHIIKFFCDVLSRLWIHKVDNYWIHLNKLTRYPYLNFPIEVSALCKIMLKSARHALA